MLLMSMISNETELPNRQAASLPTKKRRWPRWIAWAIVALLAVVFVAALASVLWLRAAARAALPTLDGQIRLDGLASPVIVRRDAHGTPHIEAATQDDLWLAQGYVTAQDRLWQMDAMRRSSNGELAEVLGSAMLKHDIAQRVLRIRSTAQRLYAALAPEDRQRLDAYVRGVNLYIAQHGDALPVEFRLLGYKPRPWTGADSISVGLAMAQTLDTQWPTKLARERVEELLKHDRKLIGDLYPVGSWRDHPPTGELPAQSQPKTTAKPARSTGDDDEDEDAPERTE